MEKPEIAVKRGIRSSLLGVGINLALATLKCAAGVIGHSFASSLTASNP
jgi:divalent metal cation (Fe/Co/Zn/Cd) transporter